MALAIAVPAAGCRRDDGPHLGQKAPRLPALDARHAPLRERFDADVGGRRILMLASPTCASCVQSVKQVIDEVVNKVPGTDLHAYVVWLRTQPEDDAGEAARAAQKLADPRVTHYWDPDRSLSWMLGTAFQLPPRIPNRSWGFAWDVYLAYPAGVRWDAVTTPTIWMQQLDGVPPSKAPKLDVAALRKVMEGMAPK